MHASGAPSSSSATDPLPSSMRCRSSGEPSTSACSEPDQNPCRSSVLPIWMRSRSRMRPASVNSSRVVVKCRALAATTVGCGSTSRSPATSRVHIACDSRVAEPGSVTVAAALRRRSRAPGSTTIRTWIESPPSGVAAADTRCTVSGSVRRAASPPECSMRGARSRLATMTTSDLKAPAPAAVRAPMPAPEWRPGRRSARSAPSAVHRAPPRRRGASPRGRHPPAAPGRSC